MRNAAKYLTAVAVLAAVVVVTWRTAQPNAGAEHDGFHLVCTAPECGRHFVVPRNEFNTYPADPQSQRMKCEACGQFTAVLAKPCATCGRWYPATDGAGCPTCAQPDRPAGR